MVLSLLSKIINNVPAKPRRSLAEEGRGIRARIEALGVPRMWGMTPPDILQDARQWQKKCADAGLSSAAVYAKLGNDVEHISATEVLLIIDETVLALDPPGMMGG